MAKRVLDLTIAIVVLIISSPLLLLGTIAVYFTLGRPVIFKQLRTGRGGRLFVLYKLRTMRDARDERGQPLPDSERLTPVGQFLRKTSIDELPQLWNVIRGEMSLVGPRPLLPEYLELYSPEERRRLDVKPGLASWAVVNGRNALSWREVFEKDVWYVDHQSLWLDLRILARTALHLLRPVGISQPGHVTREKFSGSNR